MLGRVKLTVVAALTVAALALSGCGKAEYEQLMETKMNQLSFASKFIQNLHQDSTEIVERVASLQLPTYIDDEVKTYRIGAKDRRGDAISPQRIQPPFMNLPGFQYCYENYVDMGGRNDTHPVYCYIASVPAKQQKLATLLGRLKTNVGKTFKGVGWQDVQLDTPDGQKVAYKKISVKGLQAFEMDSEGGDVQKMAGQFDVYVHSSPGTHLIIGFRASNEAASKIKVFENAALALGTLTVEDAEEENADS